MTANDDWQFERLSVDAIELDLENPRIARYIEMYGGTITAEGMSLALGAGDSHIGDSGTTFHSLRESIRTNKGVIHPVIVNRTPEGACIVVEGNTRVLIYREFGQQGYDGNWQTIPAMVYDDLAPERIDAIRLQTHLVGTREWDPYSKAKYLNHLDRSEHMPSSQMVDFCGGNARDVRNLIGAYREMEQYYRHLLESDDQFDPTRFSSFVEVQRPRVRQAIFDAGFTLTDFAGWVRDQLISPQNYVRQLPRILEDESSREVFLRDGAQEAVKVLYVPGNDVALAALSLADLARELVRKVAQLHYEDLQRLRRDAGNADNDMVCEARDALHDLCRDIASDD